MPKIILKSPYLKPNAKAHIDNYIKYIATRDGVEKPSDSTRQLPSTQFQNKTIKELIKKYPDITELYEYEDYIKNRTRGNADEFIMRSAEVHPEVYAARQNYVEYIATRPGAVHISKHGLFSDKNDPIILEQAANDAANSKSNIWTHIISLRREDADRLGYSDVGNWQELLRSQRNHIAKCMHISPENFRWYAAFHNADHHPHVHLIAYSIDPKEAYLSKDGILKIKSALAKQIFRQDTVSIYKKQTHHRNELRHNTRDIVREIVSQINSREYDNPKMQELLIKLAGRLENLSGKKQYGYLKADVKAIVDNIVNVLSEDERIKKLYNLWYEQKFEVLRTYTDTMPNKLPLSQNEAFRPIKNAVIEEAQNILLNRLTFEDEIDDTNISDQEFHDMDETGAKANKYDMYIMAKQMLDVSSNKYNSVEGIRLLSICAENGSENAQYQLGKMLLYGQETSRDIHMAIKLLTASANQGNIYAAMLLKNYSNRNSYGGASVAIGSMRLMRQLSKIIENHFEENYERDNSGQIENKLYRQINEKKQSHGLRM